MDSCHVDKHTHAFAEAQGAKGKEHLGYVNQASETLALADIRRTFMLFWPSRKQ